MAILTSGRSEPCLDNVGGIKRIYLFKYEDYTHTQIVGVKGSTLTSFPGTAIYGYECVLATFEETINNDDDGISVDQTLSFTLTKQDLLTTRKLENLLKIDVRYIVQYNNGKYRIGGLFNGAEITEIKALSGGNKADLNGYQITIKSEEEYAAAFIDDLDAAGFSESLILLLEDLDILLLENSDELILE